MNTVHIHQRPLHESKFLITLTLKRPGQADLEGEAAIVFGLSPQRQGNLRCCLENHLALPDRP